MAGKKKRPAPDRKRSPNASARAGIATEDTKTSHRAQRRRVVPGALPVLVAYLDRDHVFRFCNASHREWFDLDRAEIEGRRLEDVIGPDAREMVAPYVEQVLAGEEVVFRQRGLRYRYGGTRDVQITYIPHHGAPGEVIGYYAMVEDISDRLTLERTQARLAAIVADSFDAIIGKDLDGIVTSWNAAAERMYGFTAREMVGRSLTAVVPEERAHEVTAIIDRLRRELPVENFETVRRHRDGTELQVSLTASPIRDSEGELIGVSTIARDITEKHRQRLALEESRRRLELAQSAAQLGIHDYDVRTGRVLWDERIRRIWGIPDDETITYERFLEGVHPDDRDRVQRAVDRALDPSGNGRFRAEYRVIQHRTRVVRWVEATGIVTFQDQMAVRLVGTLVDITERRNVEERLEEADRRKDQFLATLGHELRNPLGALLFALECLRSDPTDEEREQYHDTMKRQADRMKSLLNDLLDIGRITRGDVPLRLQRVTLAEHVRCAMETVDARREEAGHTVTLDVDPDDLELVADPVRLEQIVVNLLSNAIRYTTSPGTIAIRGRAVHDAVEITVTDTGIGFDDAAAERLFDLFFQARKGAGGLGIGLSLVRSLVGLHGGSVRARSDGPGRGSTFHVVLPRTLPVTPEATDPETAGESADLAGLRVLVVDDHEDLLRPLVQVLSSRCETRSASTGEAGLAVAREFRPHVLLLDLSLPDMSGLEVAEAVREIEGLADSVCVAVTGFGDAATADQVRRSSFEAHLVKPVEFEDILDLLGQLVRDGRVRPDPGPGERPLA